MSWGDPHIRTLDNMQYVFNGLGEYWMIESPSFELQVRTVAAWDSRRQPSVTGTVLGAVAARALYQQSNITTSSARVHVHMPADRTSSKSSLLSPLQLSLTQRRRNVSESGTALPPLPSPPFPWPPLPFPIPPLSSLRSRHPLLRLGVWGSA